MCTKICHWHRCGARFVCETERARQTRLYCSHECKQRHRQWTIARGAPLVEVLLLIEETRRMNDCRRRRHLDQLQSRMGANVPGLVDDQVPTLTDLWRIVRSWRAEMAANEGADRTEKPQ
jgi:hypothetical protein